MTASSLWNHVEITHGKVMTQNRGVDVGRGGSNTYVVSFPHVLISVACPVEGCPSMVHIPVRLPKTLCTGTERPR